MMLLAQAQQSTGNGGILAPFVIIFGWIIRAIYDGLAAMGIYNVGLCIILFTLVSKLILLPVTMKQQRSMKINQHMQPEINKITKKYRNKRDQASMMKQQEEMLKVYAKYGSKNDINFKDNKWKNRACRYFVFISFIFMLLTALLNR